MYKDNGLLDLHNETITLIYRSNHYEILYSKTDVKNYPMFLGYDEIELDVLRNPYQKEEEKKNIKGSSIISVNNGSGKNSIYGNEEEKKQKNNEVNITITESQMRIQSSSKMSEERKKKKSSVRKSYSNMNNKESNDNKKESIIMNPNQASDKDEYEDDSKQKERSTRFGICRSIGKLFSWLI